MTRESPKKSNFRKKPSRLILELSRNCNLNCVMCGFGGKKITDSLFFQSNILQTIFATRNFFSDLKEIRLNGRGESTLHPNFGTILKEICSAFHSTQLSIFTNGMASKSIFSQLRQEKVQVYFSVDSANPKKYESLRKGAKFNVLQDRLRIVEDGFIVFTLQTDNLLEIKEIAKLSADLGFGLIVNVVRADDINYRKQFKSMIEKHWGNLISQLAFARSLLPKGRLLIPDQIAGKILPEEVVTTSSCGSLSICPNASEEMMIAYDGKVYPCNMFNPECLGDLNISTVREIWASKKRWDFIKKYKTHDYCQNCQYMILRE